MDRVYILLSSQHENKTKQSVDSFSVKPDTYISFYAIILIILRFPRKKLVKSLSCMHLSCFEAVKPYLSVIKCIKDFNELSANSSSMNT